MDVSTNTFKIKPYIGELHHLSNSRILIIGCSNYADKSEGLVNPRDTREDDFEWVEKVTKSFMESPTTNNKFHTRICKLLKNRAQWGKEPRSYTLDLQVDVEQLRSVVVYNFIQTHILPNGTTKLKKREENNSLPYLDFLLQGLSNRNISPEIILIFGVSWGNWVSKHIASNPIYGATIPMPIILYHPSSRSRGNKKWSNEEYWLEDSISKL